jgi:two-component system C4-dicarboxylate transport sensor histidine kinase DctB
MPDILDPARAGVTAARSSSASSARRLFRRAWPLVAIALLLSMVVWATHRAALSRSIDQLEEHSVSRLDLIATTIEATLERFRYLPEVIARSREIEAIYSYGRSADTIDTANILLARIANASKADALFVIDRNGTTLAASNYREEVSFVGENYAFRMYFQDAMRHKTGRMYAVGATSGEPGYFLSTAIIIGGETVGVAVVKIDLKPLEANWADAREDVGIRDDDGIIFLAADPRWRYRSATGLTPVGLAQIHAGKRYTGVALKSEPLFGIGTPFGQGRNVRSSVISSVDGAPERGLLMERRFTENDWTLIYLASLAEAERQASLVGLAAGLASLLFVAVGQIWRQRRKARRLERESLVRLERRVANRTRELTEANDRLTMEMAERRRTERELETTRNDLLQAGKLATIGQAFASMAHEVNQPLAALRAYLASSQLLSERGDREELAANIVLMRGVVDRLANLTGRLKSLARRTHGDRSPVDLRGSIDRIADLLTFRLDSLGIELDTRDRAKALVLADPGRLDQIALNLLTNAIDAVAEAPVRRIRIRTAHTDGWGTLTVEDSGSGLPPEVESRLFEPFVTTKEDGGLGLGLATVKTIVTDYDGSISYSTSILGGACFTIRLPTVNARLSHRKDTA